jgi:outer membrane protein assembly factor BamD (BamD/ComL family)
MDLVAQHPDLAREENLPAFIERIDRELAQKLLVTADWYQRIREPAAAAKYYRTVIETYPRLEEARRAQRELARLPRELQTPPPPLAQQPG